MITMTTIVPMPIYIGNSSNRIAAVSYCYPFEAVQTAQPHGPMPTVGGSAQGPCPIRWHGEGHSCLSLRQKETIMNMATGFRATVR
jgi:hypothetical protein